MKRLRRAGEIPLELNQRWLAYIRLGWDKIQIQRYGFYFDLPKLFLGYNLYLWVMYLKTPTSELSTYILRKVVCETILWCETNIGKRGKRLSYSVLTLPDSCSPTYGQYDPENRTIRIYRNYCKTIRMVIRTTIHEYAHSLQDLRTYDKVLKKVGYNKHPLEVEARECESLYSDCFKEIKINL